MNTDVEIGRERGIGRRGVEAIAHSGRLDALGRRLQTPLKRLSADRLGRRAKDLLNGTWLGHPLHPALTDVPLGAWLTAMVFDAATLAGKRKLEPAAQGALAVGIAGAVGAALTGIADWSDTSGEPRRIGLVHASINSLALAFQVASLWGRRRGVRGAHIWSALGTGAAMFAAYLGGDLVFRLGVQVNRTAQDRGPRAFTPAMADADLEADRPVRAVVAGAAVLLVRRGEQVFALDDVCAHAGCSLSQGRLQGDAVVCACHGSTFRLRDGAVLHGPSPFTQPTFDVRRVGGRIEVRRRA